MRYIQIYENFTQPKILYHGTKTKFLNDIIENGLQVTKQKSNSGKKYVFSTDNKTFAKIFGDYYSPSGKNDKGIIVTFIAPKNIKLDPEVEHYKKMYPNTTTLRDNMDRYNLEVRTKGFMDFENLPEKDAYNKAKKEILDEKKTNEVSF